jgi:glycogen debranching enzyme
MLRHQDLYYVYDVDKLSLGGTYANENLLVRLLADSSIGGLWSARDDQQYCGKWRTDFYVDGQRVKPARTEFAPEYQRTRYASAGVTLTKTVFVPVFGERMDIVFVIVEAHNAGKEARTLGVSSDIRYPEFGWAEYSKFPDPFQRAKRVISEQSRTLVVSRTKGRDSEVRAIGGALAIAEAHMDDQSASLVFEPVVLQPNESVTLPFAMAISPIGAEDALLTLAQIEHHREIFYQTQEYFSRVVVGTCQIATPDPLINRAVAWAKVNSFRQRTKYPIGYGFTNDPPQDVVVVRDAAWFIFGSDYFLPDFSRDMLQLVQTYGIEAGGKLTEYINCCERPPYHYDYDMNINDDTPLFVYAIHHHYCTSKDQQFLREFYPTVKGAVDWILKQKLGGLIYCSSEESNVWGICSWRNIIPGYTLTGAVTEINAECYKALRCAAELAGVLGETEDAERYAKEADELQLAINTRLISGKTGLYLLNIDVQGEAHHDLTGDLVFPAMLGVADAEMERRLLDILYTPMFWTPYGLRTVAVGEHNYDPEFGIRLVGGIWPNLTVWVAYANRNLYPDRLVEGMRNAYRICEVEDPKKFRNLVPGEFPECLHGENFQSRGMALSPWMPPTYLWLAVEGLMGIEPTVDGLRVTPHLETGWTWAAAHKVPYAGGLVSLFLHEGTVYTNHAVETEWPQQVYDEDVSYLAHSNAFVMALRSANGRAAVLVCADTATQVELTLPHTVTHHADQTLRFPLSAGESQLFLFGE